MSVLEELEREAGVPFGEARALPLGAFDDPEVAALERERIFYRDWMALCNEAALPDPGDYFAIDLIDEPILVIRDESGALRALSNVCRHRGTAILEEGYGNSSTLVCPYHAWSYDTKGQLLATPHSGDTVIERSEHCLPEFPLEVWHGIVFVNLDKQAEPLTPQLAGLEEALARYGLDRGRASNAPQEFHPCPSNWKFAVENQIECYHLFQTHRNTLEPYSPTLGNFNVAGGARWTVTAGRLEGGDFLRPYYAVVAIPPSWQAIVSAPRVGVGDDDFWYWQSVLPLTPQTCRVSGKYLLPGSDNTDFWDEDVANCRYQQRVARTRDWRGGPLNRLERIVVDFHNYLAWKLFERKPPPPWTEPGPK